MKASRLKGLLLLANFLEPGKLADLAVLSQDIFEIPADDLPKTESVMTIVGGKIVYDAKVVTIQ